MQQYFAKDEKLNLYDNDYHHIKNVMRMKKGDLIKVVYEGVVYTCKINNVSPNVDFEILSKEEKKKSSKSIVLAFSLLKEQKLDYLMQKSTEVGIDEFIPLITSRSIINYDPKKDTKKKERWKKILKEASEQSNRVDIPKINDVMSINSLINYEADLKILFTLNEKSKNIKKVLEKNNKCDKILIVTGPEGGFTNEEEQILISNGFVSCTLGSNVLRSETAPIVITSMINYEFMR